ncbi:MAG: 5-(carboxyamino)imidazole ribonucleotide synthase [Alphaproteobacteria bacterium]
MTDAPALPAGATIGILGNGQLGRMLALAAAPLGYRVHVFGPESDSPAEQVSAASTVAAYDDFAALDRFAAAVDVITYEFENVPLATAAHVAALKPLRPGTKALEVSQDRVTEKDFAAAQGARTAGYVPVDGEADFAAALEKVGTPAILKTRRLGYDGKGQRPVAAPDALAGAFAELGEAPAILERRVDFDHEVSVLVARGLDGAVAAFPVSRNTHRDGILRVSEAPDEAPAAVAVAQTLAAALDYVGVLAVEFFVAGDQVFVNEMAPRVHNSGHWTIEGCETSQFEQHVRAICGLPLGDVAMRGRARMENLIGDDVDRVPALLADPGAHVHLYGKADVRAGRKMGHVTWVRPASGSAGG